MARGKTITIYLPDGNPRGIKICEVPNSIIKAILIPRNQLKDIIQFEDISRKTGIYFLFSEKDDLSRFQTYIGEAEELLKRIKQHDNAKEDYWNYVICFVSEKDNLNKAHVKFLENYCYSEANRIGRSELKNSVIPQKANITKQEESFVLSFFDELKVLLGTLGYPIFENIRKEGYEKIEVFYCKGKNAKASGNLTEEGFVVYSESIANLEEVPSAGEWLKNTRAKLKETGVLVQEGNILRFMKDSVFNSPSAAGGVVLGMRVNGWTIWKNSQGKTLDELKR